MLLRDFKPRNQGQAIYKFVLSNYLANSGATSDQIPAQAERVIKSIKSTKQAINIFLADGGFEKARSTKDGLNTYANYTLISAIGDVDENSNPGNY